MRNLFLCFLLVGLAWLIQQGSVGTAGPAVFVGLLAVLPLLGARLARRIGLPPHIGALVAGLLLGPTGFLPRQALHAVRPFSDLATVWIGLDLGFALSPVAIADRRSLAAGASTALAAVLITFGGLWLGFQIDPVYALELGLLAAISAPYFTRLALPARSEALSLSLLTTGIGLLLWGFSSVLHLSARNLPDHLLDLGVWAACLELLYRVLRRLRTDPGRFILFGFAACLLLLGAKTREISPLFAALASGLALSLRSGRDRTALRILNPTAVLLIPFVLAVFAAGLAPLALSRLPSSFWRLFLAYTVCMAAGKTAGCLFGRRLNHSPFRDWSQSLPQGLIAALLLPGILPSSVFFPLPGLSPVVTQTAFVLICSLGLPLLLRPLQALARKRPAPSFQPVARK